jgi:hypothetical protein
MMLIAILNTVFGILLMAVYKRAPAVYPSKESQQTAESIKVFNFKYDLNLLLKNRNYLTLMIPFVLNYSVHHTLSGLFGALMLPYGYDNKTKSAVGAAYIFFGMLASLIFAKGLDKTRKYLMTLRIICFACVFVWAAGIYTLPSGKPTLMLINMSVAGFFTVPIISVGF